MPTSISLQTIKNLLSKMGFLSIESQRDVWHKSYSQHGNYEISVDLSTRRSTHCSINWGDRINFDRTTTSNFKDSETLVIIECINRLLEKGYKPECITLEKKWRLGHDGKGYLDILVSRDDESKTAFLMIECKTWGAEYEKEKRKTKENGGQLFSYYIQERSTEYLCLYTSRLNSDDNIEYMNDIISVVQSIPEAEKAPNQDELHKLWDKSFAENGIFNVQATPYNFHFELLKKNELKPLTSDVSDRLFNDFLEILRHNVVSDKPNAFNKLVNLLFCKILDEDEKNDDDILEFRWVVGEKNENALMRLNDLYKKAMLLYLQKEIADHSEQEIQEKMSNGCDEVARRELNKIYTELRLYKNQEFAFKEVYNKESFEENCIVLREIVQLIEKYQFKYTDKQQFLGDFFEQLLKESLKQEAGQFFTPVPIVRFICLSIPFKFIVNQKIQSRKPDFLPYTIDYACGAGHFITESMDIIERILQAIEAEGFTKQMRDNLYAYRNSYQWAKTFVYGIEKDWRLTKTTKLSCFLNGDGEATIIQEDGLDNFYTSKKYSGKLKSTNPEAEDNQQFDVLTANPPYSVSAFKRTLFNGEQSFELYKRLTDQSSEIECLFVERAKQLLKDEGYTGIILPSSILNNPGIHSYTREIILKYFYVKAIVEFGGATFMATGTKTIVLFLQRRPNTDWERINGIVTKFFRDFQDKNVDNYENVFNTYIEFVWRTITLDNYVSFISGEPNDAIKEHEIYMDYRQWFDNLTEIKKLKDKKSFKALSEDEQNSRLHYLFYEKVNLIERDKILFFILAYEQSVILVKSGDTEIEEKEFLGYGFSNRRPYEGLHPLQVDAQGRLITKLFNEDDVFDFTRVNSYIITNFLGDELPEVADDLKDNLQVCKLHNLISFEGVNFEKKISTTRRQLMIVEIPTKYPSRRLGDMISFEYGKALPKRNRRPGEYPVVGSSGIVGNHNEYLVEAPAIIVGRKGSVGKVTLIDDKHCFPIDTTFYLKFNPEELEYKYVYYILKQLKLENLGGGLGPGGLNRNDAYKLKIPVPPKSVQEQIVAEIESIENRDLSSTEIEVQLSAREVEKTEVFTKYL
ncbi:MAG TPA: restriction endonuclease subunit S [Flavobacterium sp.]|nr:restriction endonuclease subunit S [Flavobacterium sp.]